MDWKDTIVREIYERTLQERPWVEVVASTASALDATGAFFFTTFVPVAAGGIGVFHGLPEEGSRRFLEETVSVDVWHHELVRRHGGLRTGLTCTTDDLIPEQQLRRTRFFADYLYPGNIGRCLSTIVGDGSLASTPLTPLCFYRPFGSKPFSQADEALLRALQPHFTLGLQIRHKLAAAVCGNAALAIECISTPVIVLAADLTILFSNPAAEALFTTDGAALVGAGRLRAAGPGGVAALEQAVRACLSYRFDQRLARVVRLQGQPGNGIVIRMVPPPPLAPPTHKAAAIGFLTREGHVFPDAQAMMRALYALTPAETALIEALTEGLTLDEFADRRGIRMPTVRTQLRSVFAKTGTKRQTDLMRLAFSIGH